MQNEFFYGQQPPDILYSENGHYFGTIKKAYQETTSLKNKKNRQDHMQLVKYF